MDIPKEFLSKEFLSQFKTDEDVTAFTKSIPIKEIIAATLVMAVIRSRFKQKWANPSFKFLVIEKVNLNLW